MTRALRVRINLKDDVKTIERKLSQGIAEQFNNKLRLSVDKIKRDLKALVRDLLKVSPEIQSLRNGELRGAFGIPKEIDPTLEIIEAIVASVDVEFKLVRGGRGGVSGGLAIEIQPKDLSNLLNLPNAKVVTEKGTALPWLKWLLTLGDKIIITEFEVEYKDGSGRSGLASMSEGGTFRVNPSFSGTEENNFITRAFKGSDDKISRIIKRHMR